MFRVLFLLVAHSNLHIVYVTKHAFICYQSKIWKYIIIKKLLRWGKLSKFNISVFLKHFFQHLFSLLSFLYISLPKISSSLISVVSDLLWVGLDWVGRAVPAVLSRCPAGWGRTPGLVVFLCTVWRSAKSQPWAAFGWGSSRCSSSEHRRPRSPSWDVSSPSAWPLSDGPWSRSSFCTAYRPKVGTDLGSGAQTEATGRMEKLFPLCLPLRRQHLQEDSHTSPSWSFCPGSHLDHMPQAGERGSSCLLLQRSAGQGRSKGWSQRAPYWTVCCGCMETVGNPCVVWNCSSEGGFQSCLWGVRWSARLCACPPPGQLAMSGRRVENNWCGATVGWHLNHSAFCRITGLNLARAPRNPTRRLAVAAHLHFTSLLGRAL